MSHPGKKPPWSHMESHDASPQWKNCENDHVVFESNTLSKEVEAVKAEWKA